MFNPKTTRNLFLAVWGFKNKGLATLLVQNAVLTKITAGVIFITNTFSESVKLFLPSKKYTDTIKILL